MFFFIKMQYICKNFFAFQFLGREDIDFFPQKNYDCSQSSRTPILISLLIPRAYKPIVITKVEGMDGQ